MGQNKALSEKQWKEQFEAKNVKKGQDYIAYIKELDDEVGVVVDRDGLTEEGKIVVRCLSARADHDAYGRRYEITADDVQTVRRSDLPESENTKEARGLERMEKNGEALFEADGKVIGLVRTGMGVVFKDGDNEIGGVIAETCLQDGKVSAIAITRNYGRRYQVLPEDVMNITFPKEGSKKAKQYNKALEKAGVDVSGIEYAKDTETPEEKRSREILRGLGKSLDEMLAAM